jgi:hypothetical protein
VAAAAVATVVVVVVAEAAEAAEAAVVRRRMWGRCRLLHIVGRLPLLLSD